MTTIDDFEREREYLTRLAYRMLGSVADAEDVVQESYLRWRDAGEPELDSTRAWFTRTCTRLCLDRLKSAQRQREQYVGVWLPEPLLARDAESPSPADREELDETLSIALLLTIERLRPTERAAFLLHDVFGYEFTEVAAILDLEPANCRQLASRARRKLERERPDRPAADAATVRDLSTAFFAAVDSGDLDGLRAVLADDVVLRADGGGEVAAARVPVCGADRVARFMVTVARVAASRHDVERHGVWFNGRPGTVVAEDGTAVSAFQFEVAQGRITAIYVQRNPAKLAAFRHDGSSRLGTGYPGARPAADEGTP